MTAESAEAPEAVFYRAALELLSKSAQRWPRLAVMVPDFQQRTLEEMDSIRREFEDLPFPKSAIKPRMAMLSALETLEAFGSACRAGNNEDQGWTLVALEAIRDAAIAMRDFARMHGLIGKRSDGRRRR